MGMPIELIVLIVFGVCAAAGWVLVIWRMAKSIDKSWGEE